MKLFVLLMIVMVLGCSTTKKLLVVDTPKGYVCKTHGANPHSYKIAEKYYCTICVDHNLGKVELVVNELPKRER